MRKTSAALTAASLLAIISATPALAQDAAAPAASVPATSSTPADTGQSDKDIVVTGTQIRGIAPPGANTISLNAQQIQSTGATNTQQLLGTIPQTSAFNNLGAELPGQGVSAGVTRVPIARPNIRNLPGCAGSGSGACTLILLDGNRIVPAGIEQTAVDPSVIPPGMIERVETILDGSSAIYGSDAIGGVINFITKKNFTGVSVDGRYGIGKDYHSIDANATVGLGWGTGSIMASYSYGYNDSVFGKDRSYFKSVNGATGLPTGTQCDAPNVQSGALTFAGPSFAPGLNLCDQSQFSSIYPTIKRNTGFAKLTQDLGGAGEFSVSGFYSDFRTESNTGPLLGSVTLANFPLPIPIPGASGPNPFFQMIAGVPTFPLGPPPAPLGQNYSVLFSYGPAFGNEAGTQDVGIVSYQVTPSWTFNLGKDWQIRALASYGYSQTTTSNHSINPITQLIAAGGTTTATALNPFNVAATNAAVLAGLGSWFDLGVGTYKMYNDRLSVDGTLLSLPGGNVKLAAGVEYMNTSFVKTTNNVQTFAFNPPNAGAVSSVSLFGELYVPLVGPDNSMPLIHRLNVDLSGRYDDYDQGVGGTFNPKIGATYEPINGITIRGNWGTSFNAPTPADRADLGATAVLSTTCGNPCGFAPAGTVLPPAATYSVLFATGTAPGLKPQTSTNWSVGLDLHPAAVPGLIVSGTYYNITIKNFISLPQISGSVQQSFSDFPELVSTFSQIQANPALLTNFCGIAPGGAATCAPLIANQANVPIAVLVDNRTRNLGLFKVSGVDMSVSYRHNTGFGSVDMNFNANYQLERNFQPHLGDPIQDTLFTQGVPDFTSRLTLGANISALRAQATWNHSAGYAFLTTPGVNLQNTVAGFDTFDLFFRYAVPGSGMFKDLAFTLTGNNVLDADPPIFLTTTGASGGVAPNIRTLGRVVLFGVEKKF